MKTLLMLALIQIVGTPKDTCKSYSYGLDGIRMEWVDPPGHTTLTLELLDAYLKWCEEPRYRVVTVVNGKMGMLVTTVNDSLPSLEGFAKWMKSKTRKDHK